MASLEEATKVSTGDAFTAVNITANGTFLGNVIDTETYQSIEFIMSTIVYVDGTYTPQLRESNDSSFTTSNIVDPDFLLGTISDATLDTVGLMATRLGTISKKRFLRFDVIVTNFGTDTSIGTLAVLGNASTQPPPETI